MGWRGTLGQFDRKMSQVGWAMEKKSIRKLTDEAADIAERKLRQITPVGKTGNLLASLSQSAVPAGRGYSLLGYTAPHAPMIILHRRRSKKTGRMVGSLQKGRGNRVYRARKTVDAELGHLSDKTVGEVLGR